MKLPRDVGGRELAGLLSKFDYRIGRRSGSHIRLTSTLKGAEHHVTIPEHKPLKPGTLNSVIKEVASYLEMDRQKLIEELFGHSR